MKILQIILFIIISIPAWGQSKIVFIVNTANPLNSLTTHQISEMVLKKEREWPNGLPVRFFDRGEESIERNAFLRNFLQKSSRDLDQYWIGQKLYTGNSEPSKLKTSRMVLAMVSRFPGAISYVLEEKYVEKKV